MRESTADTTTSFTSTTYHNRVLHTTAATKIQPVRYTTCVVLDRLRTFTQRQIDRSQRINRHTSISNPSIAPPSANFDGRVEEPEGDFSRRNPLTRQKEEEEKKNQGLLLLLPSRGANAAILFSAKERNPPKQIYHHHHQTFTYLTLPHDSRAHSSTLTLSSI